MAPARVASLGTIDARLHGSGSGVRQRAAMLRSGGSDRWCRVGHRSAARPARCRRWRCAVTPGGAASTSSSPNVSRLKSRAQAVDQPAPIFALEPDRRVEHRPPRPRAADSNRCRGPACRAASRAAGSALDRRPLLIKRTGEGKSRARGQAWRRGRPREAGTWA